MTLPLPTRLHRNPNSQNNSLNAPAFPSRDNLNSPPFISEHDNNQNAPPITKLHQNNSNLSNLNKEPRFIPKRDTTIPASPPERKNENPPAIPNRDRTTGASVPMKTDRGPPPILRRDISPHISEKSNFQLPLNSNKNTNNGMPSPTNQLNFSKTEIFQSMNKSSSTSNSKEQNSLKASSSAGSIFGINLKSLQSRTNSQNSNLDTNKEKSGSFSVTSQLAPNLNMETTPTFEKSKDGGFPSLVLKTQPKFSNLPLGKNNPLSSLEFSSRPKFNKPTDGSKIPSLSIETQPSLSFLPKRNDNSSYLPSFKVDLQPQIKRGDNLLPEISFKPTSSLVKSPPSAHTGKIQNHSNNSTTQKNLPKNSNMHTHSSSLSNFCEKINNLQITQSLRQKLDSKTTQNVLNKAKTSARSSKEYLQSVLDPGRANAEKGQNTYARLQNPRPPDDQKFHNSPGYASPVCSAEKIHPNSYSSNIGTDYARPLPMPPPGTFNKPMDPPMVSGCRKALPARSDTCTPRSGILNELNFNDIDTYARETPDQYTKTLESLADYLNRCTSNEIEKARVIFTWIATYIGYDFEMLKSKDNAITDSIRVLQRRSTICHGYAQLFLDLATLMNLKAKLVMGKAAVEHASFDSDDSSHSWNAVEICNEWHLLDACWGSGYGDNQMNFIRKFSPWWFLMEPATFVYTHLPTDPKMQLLESDKILSAKDFVDAPFYKNIFWSLKVRLWSHKKREINTQVGEILKIYLIGPEKYSTQCGIRKLWGKSLEKSNDLESICQECPLSAIDLNERQKMQLRPGESIYEVILFPKSVGVFFTTIFMGQNRDLLELVSYKLNVIQSSDGALTNPGPFATTYTNEFVKPYLVSPIHYYIPRGNYTKFRMISSEKADFYVKVGTTTVEFVPVGNFLEAGVNITQPKGTEIIISNKLRSHGSFTYQYLYRFEVK